MSNEDNKNEGPLTVGIVMPISAIDGCSSEHWADVKNIIMEAVSSIVYDRKFVAKLVSDADDVGVIQNRIVTGVYESDVIVCDVSAKNANVMFELGMRLAFDRATVIVKDDKTDYSFDTSVIEHLSYPRDLRFYAVNAFKARLAEKILATYKSSLDPKHPSFLKSFGTFNVSKLDQKELSADQAIITYLIELQEQMSSLTRAVAAIKAASALNDDPFFSAQPPKGLLDAGADYQRFYQVKRELDDKNKLLADALRERAAKNQSRKPGS